MIISLNSVVVGSRITLSTTFGNVIFDVVATLPNVSFAIETMASVVVIRSRDHYAVEMRMPSNNYETTVQQIPDGLLL